MIDREEGLDRIFFKKQEYISERVTVKVALHASISLILV